MKKAKFFSSQYSYSSEGEESESSDDEIPDRNIDSQTKHNEYSLFLARRTKELLDAFPSDSQNGEKSPMIPSQNKKPQNSQDPIQLSNHLNDDSPIIHSPIKKSTASPDRTVRLNLTFPEIPKNRRQQLLNENIQLIYNFFDHKIPVRSIILAIHDHAGLVREAVQTLNKHPTKYDNYSLAEFPSSSDQPVINRYLRYMS